MEEFVLQAQEGLCGAGITLTASPATKLIVNTAAFMAFGANNT